MRHVPNLWLTSADAARRLGLSQSQVNRLAHTGELPGQKWHGRWIFHVADVQRHADRRAS